MSNTPITDAILSLVPGGQTCDPQIVADELRPEIERLEIELTDAISERDALRKTADKLDEDKECNARLCETLRADLEAERALADRLAKQLDGCAELTAAHEALAAWREARTPSGYNP
jgi:thioesterase domain-containing protein